MKCMNEHKKLLLINLGISFFITILWALISYKCFPILLNTDDVAMKNILAGHYTGEPDAHVYFIMYPLACIIKLGYKLFKNSNVYFLFLELLNLSCLFFFVFRVLQIFKNLSIKVLLIGLYFILFSRFFVYTHWTTTAGMLCALGLFWFATIRWKRKSDIILDYLVIVISFSVAFNIRREVMYLFLPIAALIYIRRNWKKIKAKRFFAAFLKALPIVVVGVVCLICLVIHNAAYSSPEWKTAREYLSYRSMLNDRYGYPDYDKNIDIYKEAGIDKATFQCMAYDYDYLFAATGRVSVEALESIANRAKELYDSGSADKLVKPRMPGYTKELYANSDTLFKRIGNCIKNEFKMLFNETYRLYSIIVIVLMCFCIVICGIKKQIIKILCDIFSVLAILVIWMYLLFGGRLPSHIVYCLYMCSFMYGISILPKAISKKILYKYRLASNILCISLGVLLLSLNAYSFARLWKQSSYDRYISDIKDVTFDYCDLNSNDIFIRDILSLNYYEIQQDNNHQKGINALPYVTWIYNFPLECQYLPLDGSVNVCEWLKGKNNIYFLIREDRLKSVYARRKAVLNNQGIRTKAKVVKIIEPDVGKKMCVVKLVCR